MNRPRRLAKLEAAHQARTEPAEPHVIQIRFISPDPTVPPLDGPRIVVRLTPDAPEAA